MGELEQKLIQLAADKIKLWVGYIDDIILIWLGDQTSFENFVQSCNKLHPTIKFTSECSATEINFLDMTIYKGTDFQTKQILDIKTYTKPTDKHTYVHGSWLWFCVFYSMYLKAGIHGATSCRFVACNSNEYGQMFRKPSVN